MRLDLDQRNSFTVYPENAPAESGVDRTLEMAAEHLRAGIKAAQNGNRGTARTELLKAVEMEPRNESAWLWLSSISEYPEELLAYLTNVLEINPANARALEWAAATKSLMAKNLVQRGIDALDADQRETGVHLLNQALEYDEHNSLAWLWLASAAVDDAEKLGYFEKVLEFDAANETALAGRDLAKDNIAQAKLAEARGAALRGDLVLANELLDQALLERPDAEDAWMLKSHVAFDLESKVNAFKRIIEINPENSAARANLEALAWVATPAARSVSEDGGVNTEESDTEAADAEHEGGFEFSNVAHDSEPVVSEFPQQELETAEELHSEFHEASPVDSFDDQPEFDEQPVANSFQDEETSGFAGSFADDNADDVSVGVQEADDQETTEESSDSDGGFEVINYELADEAKTEAEDAWSNDAEPSQESDTFADAWKSEPAEGAVGDFEQYSAPVVPPVNPFDSFATDNDNDLFKTLVSFDIESLTDGEMKSDESAPFEVSSWSNGQTDRVNAFDAPFDVTMYGGSHIPMPGNELDEAVPPSSTGFETNVVSISESSRFTAGASPCPFCGNPNEAQAVSCHGCLSILTLADLEMILANHNADKGAVRSTVEAMERERASGDMTEAELTTLGIGHLNLRNLQFGYDRLLEASQKNPNNVVLSGQVNALLIRLEEIKLQAEAQEAMLKGKKILVVDDSPTVRKLIAGKLEKCGHEVHCSGDGVEAMEQMENFRPDLVLLDINMPRMDGYQVCKLIRSKEETKDVPVVMISGKDGFFDKVRGRMAGTSGYITKPFGPETLMKAVESFLAPEV